MKRYIAAGILATALLASGCGKFVRDELITMQNEIDQLYGNVRQLNEDLASLQAIVKEMNEGGYIMKVDSVFSDDGRIGFKIEFNGDRQPIELFYGKNGQDGKDADSPEITVKQDEETGRWYWFMGEDWLCTPDGERILVDGKDGKSPTLKIEEGYWYISWDGGEEWEKTEWSAKGQDAFEIFSNIQVFEDRVELTLASDASVLVIPRFLPIDLALVLEGQDLSGDVLIAPEETLSIRYSLTGTGAKNALLVAGTDGRFKTALRGETTTEEEGAVVVTGIVDVICPTVFPEGGYIYITVNDGNGRSQVRVIRFKERSLKPVSGDATYAAPAEGETGRVVTFESNFEVVAVCAFPEGVEPWLTVKTEAAENIVTLTYDILPNTGEAPRKGVILVYPKDHPDFEMYKITVDQAGVPAPPTGGTGSGE